MDSMVDVLVIRRVVNGWVVTPGQGGVTDFTHVYATPSNLAAHVLAWANAQEPETKFPQ